MDSPGQADVPVVVPGLTEVRDALDRVGYRLDGLRAVLAVQGDLPARAADITLYQRRLAAHDGPLADVIALLALGWARPADRVTAALGRREVDLLVSGGALVPRAPGDLHATLRIMPHGDLWISSDRRPEPGTTTSPLHVTGINPPATLLGGMTVRRDGETALDLGTGNGIQALLARRHNRRVVATDVNPRALAFAGFNAALNGIDGIELREGSWFAPVADERFDLLVANPPYVISPENSLVYRDSGAAPGALVEELVGNIPERLASGGFATLLASWPLGDRPWWEVPTGWLRGPCRAWLIQLQVEDTLLHAGQWNAPLVESGDLDGFAAAVDRWVDYTASHGIDRIGYGAVVLQHCPDGPSVVRADEARSGSGSASEHIQRVFRAAEALAGPEDGADPAELICLPAADLRISRDIVADEGGWGPGPARLTLSEGVGIEVTLDPMMTDVFLAATSGRTARSAVAAVATASELTDEDRVHLLDAATKMMRELVSLGLVLAAGAATQSPNAK